MWCAPKPPPTLSDLALLSSIVVHTRGFAGTQKRVVIVEGLWPNRAYEEGIGINLLTSADPGLPHDGAVFHDTSVWLRPA